MKTLTVILILFTSYFSQAEIPDSLFKRSDIVLSGNIKSINGPLIDDLGTEIYFVNVLIDTIYKLNTHVNLPEQTITWEVSNLRCKEREMSECVYRFSNGKWLFFLQNRHLRSEGGWMDEHSIYPFTENNHSAAIQLASNERILINPWATTKLCSHSCNFCKNIENEKWQKVKRKIARDTRRSSGIRLIKHSPKIRLIQHRNVKYVLPMGEVLASLPSYGYHAISFHTKNGDIEKLAGFQLGIIKYLFCIHLYEDVDYLKLQSFIDAGNFNQSRIYAMKLNQLSRFNQSDTVINSMPAWNPPDEFYLLKFNFEYDKYYFSSNGILNVNEKAYIDSLEKDEMIYTLCMLNLHPDPQVRTWSLQALSRMNNPNTIPFLIGLAEFHTNVSPDYNEMPTGYQSFIRELVETLDRLTDCRTPHVFGSPLEEFRLGIGLSYWKTKYQLK